MKYKFLILFPLCLTIGACANAARNKTALDYKLAVDTGAASANAPVKLVPVPIPGQLMSTKKHTHSPKLTGEAAIMAANKKAIRQPSSGEYINSIMNFDYMPGALYQIYCAPLSVTDIQFQNNEHVISAAAGDTLRWQVSKTFSGSGANKQEHLLIKPIEADITNSLVVTTDQRTYHLMLHATAKTYMASVTWRYPDGDGLLTDLDNNQIGNNSIDNESQFIPDINNLNFNYHAITTKGKRPEWFPQMVFNDGSKTYIKFSSQSQEAPTLFIGDNKSSELVNYRVAGNYYIVDSVISHALLRGGSNGQTTIQISYKN